MKWIGSDIERNVRRMMLDYLPKIYENSKVVDEIIRVDADELENFYNLITDVFNQFFASSATWGLTHWERVLDIQTVESDSYETRRARVITKLSGNNTFTKVEALALAKVFSYAKINVSFKEDNKNGIFKTIYEVDDLTDLVNLLDSFEEVKPAHLKQIVGLIIKLPFMEKDELQVALKQFETFLYDYNLLSREKIVMMLSDIKYVLLNGEVDLDGSIKLDSVNTVGANLFYNKTTKLVIKTYKDGVLQEETTV